ncbi:MAG: dihydrodipicolinate synthase family protein [Spirochaetales bacterium]|nr:dihydrodipicolinate synthase family protein [Spirochaetales bacterium]
MKELKDIVALIPTPFGDDGELDETSLKRLIDFELDNGCSAVGVLAAIGEGYLVSHEDWRRVVEVSAKHMAGNAPLMVGCPTMSTVHAVQLCREAEDLGAGAILGFNPQGFRAYKEEELVDHYRAMTDAVKIPIAPYSRGEDPVPFPVLRKLVEEKRISYMKYAWKSCALLKEMAEHFGEGFFIFCGADTLTLRYLLLGCKGVSTATAAMLPKEHVDLLAMLKKGEVEQARAFYDEAILPWNDIGFYDMNTWHSVHKVALKEMGIIKSAKIRAPQASLAPHQVEEVKFFLRNRGKIT